MNIYKNHYVVYQDYVLNSIILNKLRYNKNLYNSYQNIILRNGKKLLALYLIGVILLLFPTNTYAILYSPPYSNGSADPNNSCETGIYYYRCAFYYISTGTMKTYIETTLPQTLYSLLCPVTSPTTSVTFNDNPISDSEFLDSGSIILRFKAYMYGYLYSDHVALNTWIDIRINIWRFNPNTLK